MATYKIVARGAVTLHLTKAEAAGLAALAEEGAEGLLTDKAAARTYIGNGSQIAAAERSLVLMQRVAYAIRQKAGEAKADNQDISHLI